MFLTAQFTCCMLDIVKFKAPVQQTLHHVYISKEMTNLVVDSHVLLCHVWNWILSFVLLTWHLFKSYQLQYHFQAFPPLYYLHTVHSNTGFVFSEKKTTTEKERSDDEI